MRFLILLFALLLPLRANAVTSTIDLSILPAAGDDVDPEPITNSITAAKSDIDALWLAVNALSGGSLTIPPARTNALGGLFAQNAATGHSFVTYVDNSGNQHVARPVCGDLSNSAASCATDATNASNISTGSLDLARLGQGGATLGQAVVWNGSVYAPATISGSLPTLPPNQILSTLTTGQPSGASMPSCSGAASALTWTSGVGPGCHSITTSGVTYPVPTAQTASYTLAQADGGNSTTPANFVQMNCATSCILTVPPNSSVALTVGVEIPVAQTGVGSLTIAGGSGVSVHSSSTLQLYGQYSVAVIKQVSTDQWIVAGDLQ